MPKQSVNGAQTLIQTISAVQHQVQNELSEGRAWPIHWFFLVETEINNLLVCQTERGLGVTSGHRYAQAHEQKRVHQVHWRRISKPSRGKQQTWQVRQQLVCRTETDALHRNHVTYKKECGRSARARCRHHLHTSLAFISIRLMQVAASSWLSWPLSGMSPRDNSTQTLKKRTTSYLPSSWIIFWRYSLARFLSARLNGNPCLNTVSQRGMLLDRYLSERVIQSRLQVGFIISEIISLRFPADA